MNSLDNTVKIPTEDKQLLAADQTQPKVYFRGINRIHINRFKAYTHILANRLNATWLVTDDIKSANIVVDLILPENNNNKKALQMSVLAGTANLKPPVLMAFKLVFDDKKMVQLLNQASWQLSRTYPNKKPAIGTEKVIKVCGLLNKSLSSLCDKFNKKSQSTRFIPSVGVISSQIELYQNQLLLIVDGEDEESVMAYEFFIAKKQNANIIIDEFTVAIIKSKDQTINEKIFDLVYSHSDEHTQVTLLNMEDDNELDIFVAYF